MALHTMPGWLATPVSKQLEQPQEESPILAPLSPWCGTLECHIIPLLLVSSSVKEVPDQWFSKWVPQGFVEPFRQGGDKGLNSPTSPPGSRNP